MLRQMLTDNSNEVWDGLSSNLLLLEHASCELSVRSVLIRLVRVKNGNLVFQAARCEVVRYEVLIVLGVDHFRGKHFITGAVEGQFFPGLFDTGKSVCQVLLLQLGTD